ncbi:MAG: hypothetical protein V4556_09130 [Bacteroidota bacterium]
MAKQVIALTILLAFVLQMFNKAFIVVDYLTNTKAFAKNCVNKAKPKMRCNGKCQMMKRLEQEEKKEQQVPERKSENKFETISSRSFFAVLPLHSENALSINYRILSAPAEKRMPRSHFHPPSA